MQYSPLIRLYQFIRVSQYPTHTQSHCDNIGSPVGLYVCKYHSTCILSVFGLIVLIVSRLSRFVFHLYPTNVGSHSLTDLYRRQSIHLSHYRMVSIILSRFILDLREVDSSSHISMSSGPVSSLRFASFLEGNIAAEMDDSWFTGIEQEEGEE